MLSTERFNEIFNNYYTVLKIYAQRFVLDSDIADDILQDVFLNLWKKRKQFESRGPIKSYLYTSVYNGCINYIKQKKVRTDYILNNKDSFMDYYFSEIRNNRDIIFTDIHIQKLKTIIDGLPEQCKRVYILSRKLGLKNREIAEFLDISIKVVEKHISKALKLLQKQAK